MNKCIICGKNFKPEKHHPNAQTCSRVCNKRWYYLRYKNKLLKPRKEYALRKCRFCKKKFKPKRFDQKFCSKNCSRLDFNKQRKKHILKQKKCKNCSKIFVPDKRHPQANFCSEKCNKAFNYQIKYKKHKEGWNTIKYCLNCGKKIIFDKTKPLNTELIRKHCSKKCRSVYAEKRFKYNNPKKYKEKLQRRKLSENYKFSRRFAAKVRRLKIKNAVEHNFSYKEWEEKKKNAKGICSFCKKYVGIKRLVMDHIYPVSRAYKDFLKTGKKRKYTLKDVQSLCEKCNQDKLDKF